MPKPLSIHRIWLGRDAEMAELASGLDDLSVGRGSVFLASGEPGIGKTRLAEEVAESAAVRGFSVHWGRAWESGGAPSFWVFTQVMRDICRGLSAHTLGEVVGSLGPELLRVLPELARQIPGLTVAPMPVVDDRFRLFEAVEAFLGSATKIAPRLVVLDDLHAADPSSLELLDFLVRIRQPKPLMLLGTYRDVEMRLAPALASTLQRIAREARLLLLERLDRGAVAEFVAQASGATPAQEHVDAVHRLTEGIPLFVREFLQLKGMARRVPDGVREVIRGRLSLLEPPARGTLEAAAVLGREFDIEPLSVITGMSDVEVRGSIEPAAHIGIVEPIEQPPRWRFTHSLLREALYEALPAEHLRALHRAAAEALAGGDRHPPLSRIAHHMFHAVPAVAIGEAAVAATRAARRAIELLAFEDAIDLLSRSCKMLEGAPGMERQLGEALLDLGIACIRAAEIEHGKEACRRAVDIGRSLGDGELIARAALIAGYENAPWMRNGALIAELEEALAMLRPGDSGLRARCMAQLAAERQPEPNVQPVLALARDAVAMARRVGEADALLRTLSSASIAMSVFADPAEGLSMDREALRLALSAGDLRLALRAHMHLSGRLLQVGDLRGAQAQIHAFNALLPRALHERFRWLTAAHRLMVAIVEGRFEEAERLLAETTERLGDDEARGGALAAAPAFFCRISERYQDLPAVESRVRSAFGRLGHELADCVGEMLIAQLHGRAGDHLRASAQLDAVRAHPLYYSLEEPSWLVLLAEPCHLVGDRELAAELYPRLLSHAERLVSLLPLTLGCEPPYHQPLGLLAQVLGRHDDAVHHLTEAEAAATRAGMRGHFARLRYELAGALLLRGRTEDRERAAALLADAHTLAIELGQAALAPLVAKRAAEASAVPRVSANADEAVPPFSLDREGDTWAITSGTRMLRLRDSRGLQVLARLLASPRQEVHVLDLVSAQGEVVDLGDAGPMLDAAAITSYRQRVRELEEELADAERDGDLGRIHRARAELDVVADELARCAGLGGRQRRTGSAAERARTTVQKRLRAAIGRIAESFPELSRYLERTIRTGTFCVYRPEHPHG
jgi:hypothetical protein